MQHISPFRRLKRLVQHAEAVTDLAGSVHTASETSFKLILNIDPQSSNIRQIKLSSVLLKMWTCTSYLSTPPPPHPHLTESFSDSQRDGNKENGGSVTPSCCFTFGGRGECCWSFFCRDHRSSVNCFNLPTSSLTSCVFFISVSAAHKEAPGTPFYVSQVKSISLL